MKVTILGRDLDVQIPCSFAEREDLVRFTTSPGVHQGRVYAAVLGRCTEVGVFAAADAEKRRVPFPDYDTVGDVLKYGGGVYDFLRSRGLSPEAIRVHALPILSELMKLCIPTPEEVAQQVDFTSPHEGNTT